MQSKSSLNINERSDKAKVQKVHSSTEFKDIQTFDLTNPDYKIHDLLPTLELINQRFSQLFRHAISSIFRHNIDVQCDTVESLQVGAYLANESRPDITYAYKSTTLKFTGFMAIESPMLFSLLDIFFNGSGTSISPKRSELTPAEVRILVRILKAAADKQTEAWESILSYKIKLAENNNSPISALFRSDTEIILLSQFTLHLGSQSSKFHIIMPYQALEPVREKLQAFKFAEHDPQWERNMLLGLMQAPMEISSKLCEVDVSLKDVMRLKPGRIIQVEIPPNVTVTASGIPCFKASVCTVNDMIALKITKKFHNTDTEVQQHEVKEINP